MISAGTPLADGTAREHGATREAWTGPACLMKHSRAETLPVPGYVGQACLLGFHQACRATDCVCVCHEGRP